MGEAASPDRVRYWLDTEFIEDGHTIDLISIGVVCEDGREFYAEVDRVDWHNANDWVRENVLPHLWSRQTDKANQWWRDSNRWWGQEGHAGGVLSRAEIARQLRVWVSEGGGVPEFWAYYADYDWVVVCQLYGPMINLPDGWPMLCLDLKQEAIRLGVEDLPTQTSTEHHALADARWNREVFEFLAKSDG